MKTKRVLKVLIVMLLLLSLSALICNNVNASSSSWFGNTMASIEDNSHPESQTGNSVTKIMGAIINIASIVGAGIAIIMLVVIGINYVSKGASGKAEAKKDLTSYIVGAVILFGVSGILKLLQMFIDGNFNNI